jgi:solute carrier family 25 phosphate transporter 3
MASSAPPTSTGSAKLDAIKQNVAAATPEKLSGVALYSR